MDRGRKKEKEEGEIKMANLTAYESNILSTKEESYSPMLLPRDALKVLCICAGMPIPMEDFLEHGVSYNLGKNKVTVYGDNYWAYVYFAWTKPQNEHQDIEEHINYGKIIRSRELAFKVSCIKN